VKSFFKKSTLLLLGLGLCYLIDKKGYSFEKILPEKPILKEVLEEISTVNNH